jgi:hypothetical protein
MDITKEHRARYLAEVEAGKAIGHTYTIKGVTMDDRCFCSCGWKSNPYWDGAEWAYKEWVEHITTEGAVIAYPNKIGTPSALAT